MNMKTRQGGIALIEALLAVLILAIGLLGTLGLQARAYSVLSEAGMRAEATIASEQLLGLMANDLDNLDDYGVALGAAPNPSLSAWYADTRERIPGAGIQVTVAQAAGTKRFQVDIRIAWTRVAGGPQNQHVTTSYLAPPL